MVRGRINMDHILFLNEWEGLGFLLKKKTHQGKLRSGLS